MKDRVGKVIMEERGEMDLSWDWGKGGTRKRKREEREECKIDNTTYRKYQNINMSTNSEQRKYEI